MYKHNAASNFFSYQLLTSKLRVNAWQPSWWALTHCLCEGDLYSDAAMQSQFTIFQQTFVYSTAEVSLPWSLLSISYIYAG